MSPEHTKLGNKCSSYIDYCVRKGSVGNCLRIFCLCLSYFQVNGYAILIVYYGYQVTETVIWSDEPRDVPYEELQQDANLIMNSDFFERWTTFMGLVFSLIGFISAGVMLHGIKTLQPDLMMPWIVFHMLFLYLYFIKENMGGVRVTYTPAFASFFIFKFTFCLFVILVVCIHYRKMHLDYRDREESKKVESP